MKYAMYAVKDEMTGKFMNPMFVEDNELADNLAIRDFKTNVNKIELWKQNANDFSLYKVGIYDDENGAEACVIDKVASGRSVLNV